jgi:hypothetical protein
MATYMTAKAIYLILYIYLYNLTPGIQPDIFHYLAEYQITDLIYYIRCIPRKG